MIPLPLSGFLLLLLAAGAASAESISFSCAGANCSLDARWPWESVVSASFSVASSNLSAAKFGGLGCQSGALSVVVGGSNLTFDCAVIASPPAPLNQPASVGASGGGGGASDSHAPSPTPDLRGGGPGGGAIAQGPSSSSSLRAVPVLVAPGVAGTIRAEEASGVVVVGVPTYGVLEVPSPPPGTPQEAPVHG